MLLNDEYSYPLLTLGHGQSLSSTTTVENHRRFWPSCGGGCRNTTEWGSGTPSSKTLLLRRCRPWMPPSALQPSIRPSGVLICVRYLRLQAKLKCRLWRCLEVCLHKCNLGKFAWSHGHGSYPACLLSLHRTWVLLSQLQYPKALSWVWVMNIQRISDFQPQSAQTQGHITLWSKFTLWPIDMLSELTLKARNIFR